MTDIHVLDASALLCMFYEEKGSEDIQAILATAVISAVNYAEAISKLHERQVASDIISAVLAGFKLTIIDFDKEQAIATAALRNVTRSKGLSLGDRACLALAVSQSGIAVTTDKAWKDLDMIARVWLVR